MPIRYSDSVLAVIPARSGSKTIPHKNIRDFCGKPLIAHSIEQARSCPLVTRTIVSTDSDDYARTALRYGAEVPFLRPAAISGDFATDLDVFQHALGWLLNAEGAIPGVCVHLRPTHPNRTPEQIAEAIRLLWAHADWDSVRSVVPSPETPFKMWFQKPDGRLVPVIESDIPEAHSQPRQMLPPTFLQNAAIDVIRSRTIVEHGSISGVRIGAFPMGMFHDIDTPAQMAAAQTAFRWSAGVPRGKTFVFDIDGVIASIVPGNDYAVATPLHANITRINRLYDAGNQIVLFTARGTVTKIDWSDLTKQQMAAWGVRHHELLFGKPAADYYVDDRMVTLAELNALDSLV
jgi:CMP-N-acetylneuraminic acid synthetase